MPRVSEILRTMEYGVAPEANDHILAWLGQHNGRFDHFIDGQTVPPKDGEYLGAIRRIGGGRNA